MQSNQLAAQEVLTWRDALRDGDGLDALGGDEAVDSPFATAVEAVFGDFEPTGWEVLVLLSRYRWFSA